MCIVYVEMFMYPLPIVTYTRNRSENLFTSLRKVAANIFSNLN